MIGSPALKADIFKVDDLMGSDCAQMPSLPAATQAVGDRLGKPVRLAATSIEYRILETLDLEARVPNAGALLTGM